MPTRWPDAEHHARAVIRRNDVGTFGIWWYRFEAMERRGGYSGPYATIAEAEEGARSWADHWDVGPFVDIESEAI